MTYILFIQGKEVFAFDGSLMTKDGQWFLVTTSGLASVNSTGLPEQILFINLSMKDEPDHWVEATSIHFAIDTKDIPLDAKTFNTKESAELFAKKWPGHPWWCMPNGNHKVVEVDPIYTKIMKGFKRLAAY